MNEILLKVQQYLDSVSKKPTKLDTKLVEEFGEAANFRAIGRALLTAGYTNEEVGKVMGDNFFRLWEEVATAK